MATSATTTPAALDLLQSAGVEHAEQFAPIFDAEIKQAAELKKSETKSVLFVCGQNAGRSQLAEALFKKKVKEVAADGIAVGFSAGNVPGKALNPVVKEAIQEIEIDTSKQFPKPITKEVAESADIIVTMGCDAGCPFFAGKKVVHWDLPDAKGKDLQSIREMRTDVSHLVDDLIKDLGVLDLGKSA